MVTKINRVGFEIECEASPDLQEKLQDFGSLGSDGSISKCGWNGWCGKLETFEFRSNPILRANIEKKSGAKGIFDILRKGYSDDEFHWNKTMGFHIHVSFNGSYKAPEIWSMEWVDYFLTKLKKEYPSVYEKRANNRYCNVSHTINDIISPGDRYKAVNYASYNKHSTVEFRIWAADEPDIMWEQLLFTIDTIEEFIKIPYEKKWTVKCRQPYSKKLEEIATTKEKLMILPDMRVGHLDNSPSKFGIERGFVDLDTIQLETVEANASKITKYI